MKSNTSPFVIAVASVSGGGKTTAVRQLAQMLPNAIALYFDLYDLEGPENMMRWMNNGADYHDWNLTPLLVDLEQLLQQPLDCIILDYPFANQHTQASHYIDYTVFIDTPLDLALSRRLLRDFSSASAEKILEDIQHYTNDGRAAYLHMLSHIKPASDTVIDGAGSIAETVQAILEKIKGVHNFT